MTAIVSEDDRLICLAKSPRLEQAMKSAKVFVGLDGNFANVHAASIMVRKDAVIWPYTYWENPYQLHSMGVGSYSMTHCSSISVGAYCSIAQNLQVLGHRHAIEHVTTSSINYDSVKPHFRGLVADYALRNTARLPPRPVEAADPVIENDVWIGQDVILARGIRLHTGCIVAGGSVVTKDVDPFTIVGGNPARPIRTRFDPRTVARLLDSQWWSLSPRVLDLGIDDPHLFLDNVDRARDTLESLDTLLAPVTWQTLLRFTDDPAM